MPHFLPAPLIFKRGRDEIISFVVDRFCGILCIKDSTGGKSMKTPDSAIIKAIYERRSVRHFVDAEVSRDLVMAALKAASWAPSGLNNQPWRLAIIWEKESKEELVLLEK